MDVQVLLDHAVWANRDMADQLEVAGWPEQPVRLLSHVVHAESAWLARCEGRPHDHELFAPLEHGEMIASSERHAAAFRHLLATRALSRIAYERANGERAVSTIEDIVVHVVTHGFHHRGQIAALLAKSDLDSRRTDYITWRRSLVAI